MVGQHFISYSPADALDFTLRLANELEAGFPSYKVWLDKRLQIHPGIDWDDQLANAIKESASLLFVMTRDSVKSQSVCKREWTRAFKYKIPIVPLLLHHDAEIPFRLEGRECINFTGNFNQALARLRLHFDWLASPAG